MEKRVAIVGAGISGLLACRYAMEKGLSPTVFEAQDGVGGLWTQTIESTKLQNPKFVFQFSGFPWPSSVEETFPHNTQVLEYIQSYAHHFGLLPHIKFNSKVIGVDYVGESHQEMQSWELWGGTGKPFGSKGKWNIKVQHIDEDCVMEYIAEFVVLCVGKFSGLPNIPEFPQTHGPEAFGGKVLHSMDFSAMDNAKAAELIKGKKVAVIGSAKSALDLAAECADANGSDNHCTMIVRTPHWALPTPNLWGVHFALLYFNRFLELMTRKPGEWFMCIALAFLLSPLRWFMSKFAESYLRWKLPLKKYNMIPPHSFLQDISSCFICMLPENFYSRVAEGSLKLKRAKCFSFSWEGLILDGETQPLKVDVVILATGFRGDEKLKSIFTSPTFQKYIAGLPNSTPPLYREVIHPRIPQLAVIGYSEGLNNLHTFEMRCMWLAHFLEQIFELPSIKEMEKDVFMREKYMKRYAGNDYGRSCMGSVQIWYHDQLCKDIGCNPRRKKGLFSELFEPYGPADYQELTLG